MSNPHGGFLWATVVGGTTGGIPAYDASLYVQYNGPLSADVSIPLSQYAHLLDVVISDNMSGKLGDDYLVTIVYSSDLGTGGISQIYTETYPMTGVGTGSVTLGTTSVAGPVQISSSSNGTAHPHIDLFGDRTKFSWSGHHALHQYAIVWHEPAFPSGYDVYMSIGDITASSGTVPVCPLFKINANTTDAYLPDVGAQKRLTAPVLPTDLDRTAWVTYRSSNGYELGLTRVDIDNTPVPSITQTSSTLFSSATLRLDDQPRIEAQALANVTTGVATYTVTGAYGPSIFCFNDAVSPSIPPVPTDTFTVDSTRTYGSYAACVTGVGPNMASGSYVGKTNFSIGYLSLYPYPSSPGTGNYFCNRIYMSGGGPKPLPYPFIHPYPYYKVNSNQTYISAGTPPWSVIAMANSSNSGDDLLTIWYKGLGGAPYAGHIYYKFAGNTYSYKNTGVANAQSHPLYEAYPNPATDHITIQGVKNAAYTVRNMLGQTIASGSVDDQNSTISTNSMASGTYMLTLTTEASAQSIKFVKQ